MRHLAWPCVGATRADAPDGYPARNAKVFAAPRDPVPPVSIENPILNSPFAEPTRHFRFDDDGITNKRSDPHAERFANGRSGSASRRASVRIDQVRPTNWLTA